ncbi:MAG: glycosyltransferase, partial [Patescibacteria group bacterium]|nr:glycosyltransferase [Patescibacteria group bacterium]
MIFPFVLFPPPFSGPELISSDLIGKGKGIQVGKSVSEETGSARHYKLSTRDFLSLNRGSDSCANKGIQKASGKYIARMDADDVCD